MNKSPQESREETLDEFQEKYPTILQKEFWEKSLVKSPDKFPESPIRSLGEFLEQIQKAFLKVPAEKIHGNLRKNLRIIQGGNP